MSVIDYNHFFEKLLAQEPERKHLRARLPILAIDECANHPAARAAVSEALREGHLDRVVDLWYQLRRREDGTHIQLGGKVVREAFPPGFDLGKPVKGHAWADEYVAQLLVAQFGASDRVILVSENTKNDIAGLRRLLAGQVKPVLGKEEHSELGLLAFMKKGRTTWEAYAQLLLARIRGTGVLAGYEYIEV